MKMIIVTLCALVAVVVAVPVQEKPEVPTVQVVSSTLEQQPDGSYTNGYALDNGVKRDETGELKEVLNEENKTVKVIVVRGSYTVPNAEGNPETVNYVADENGYKAEGNTIPKSAEVRRR